MAAAANLRVWAGGGRPVTLEGGPLPLHGLLFEPEPRPATVVLHVHGRGANMATPPGSALAELVQDPDLAHLTINLRAHDLGYTAVPEEGEDPIRPADYEVAGGMWELVWQSVEDIALAVTALRHRGYTRVVGAAHSAGGLAVATYAAEHHGLDARVMLSPLTGGTLSLARLFGDEGDVEQAVARAREMVAEGRGHLLLPARAWYFAISANSLLDRAAQPADAWATAMARDDSPVLLLWGGAETRAPLWRDFFEGLDVTRKRAVEIGGAGHYYTGRHDEVAQAVGGFLRELLAGGR